MRSAILIVATGLILGTVGRSLLDAMLRTKTKPTTVAVVHFDDGHVDAAAELGATNAMRQATGTKTLGISKAIRMCWIAPHQTLTIIDSFSARII